LSEDLLKNPKKNKFNIVMIYIEEAHAIDEWPIGSSAGVINFKHKKLADRKLCAERMIADYDFEIPVYIDSMENHFQTAYACWPFRCIIIDEKNTIQYKSIPMQAEYDFIEIYKFIESIP